MGAFPEGEDVKIINLLRRACLYFVIRSLEIRLHDQTRTLRENLPTDNFMSILIERENTKRELAKARSEYSALLPIGKRKVWGVA